MTKTVAFKESLIPNYTIKAINQTELIAVWNEGGVLVVPYIGNFSRWFNFRWVRDLFEIAKNRHSEK